MVYFQSLNLVTQVALQDRWQSSKVEMRPEKVTTKLYIVVLAKEPFEQDHREISFDKLVNRP